MKSNIDSLSVQIIDDALVVAINKDPVYRLPINRNCDAPTLVKHVGGKIYWEQFLDNDIIALNVSRE